MEVNSNIAQYLEILMNVVFVILPTLAVLAIAQPLGGRVARGFVSGWQFARSFFDDTTDPAIVELAKITRLAPDVVSKIIIDNMDSVAGILKSAIDKLEAPPKA